MLQNASNSLESSRNELTLAHAATLVPHEYLAAWDWYMRMEGLGISHLPMGQHAPEGLSIKLCSQRGIHKPDAKDLAHGWKDGRVYALTIHSSARGRYSDSVIIRPDGTWTMRYDEQVTEEGRKRKWDQNEALMNCLEDGVPVGVIVGTRGGYRVMGLAFVEQYNAIAGTFTLHGPVDRETDESQQYFLISDAELSGEERRTLEELRRLAAERGDERERKFIEKVQRTRQQRFSREVRAAYGGRCAISDIAVPTALQAAHIDDYRGSKSQVVQNGILLRADLHLLYDADLLGIKPDSHEIVLAESALEDGYDELLERQDRLRLPRERDMWPDEALLDIHYQSFKIQNRVA